MIKTSWEGNCFLNFFNNKASLGNVDKTIFCETDVISTTLPKFIDNHHDIDRSVAHAVARAPFQHTSQKKITSFFCST